MKYLVIFNLWLIWWMFPVLGNQLTAELVEVFFVKQNEGITGSLSSNQKPVLREVENNSFEILVHDENEAKSEKQFTVSNIPIMMDKYVVVITEDRDPDYRLLFKTQEDAHKFHSFSVTPLAIIHHYRLEKLSTYVPGGKFEPLIKSGGKIYIEANSRSDGEDLIRFVVKSEETEEQASLTYLVFPPSAAGISTEGGNQLIMLIEDKTSSMSDIYGLTLHPGHAEIFIAGFSTLFNNDCSERIPENLTNVWKTQLAEEGESSRNVDN